MNLLHLTLRNVLHRRFLSLLTVCAVALTVAFIVLLSLSRDSVEQGAKSGYGPFDLVIGAEGSETQLVLNSFYHIGAPTGNIPLAVLEQAKLDAGTDKAYAMTTGDNSGGFPVVGLDPEYFVTRYGDQRLQSGRLYAQTGEAVLGSHVAKTLGLQLGDTFTGAHGLIEEHESGGEHDAEESAEHGAHEEEDAHGSFLYTVAGILPPLHTPDDRAIFTTVDYAWAVHGLAPEDREITAVLVKPGSLLGAHDLKEALDGQGGVQAAYSSKAVSDVLNAVDQGSRLVGIITALCIVLAAITILLSLIAAVGERTKDAGLLRLLGKSRAYVWMSLTSEGLLLTSVGLLSGLLLGHLGAFLLQDRIFAEAGIQLNPYHWTQTHVLIVAGTLGIGLLSSLGPAFRLYRLHPLELFKS
ncbi:ABC transporter permease [Paenibacillus donghaensis]|uniref:Putative hemin transport system permease protein HrtB n=1 Tax=Paenibacillus donghaensis TaxID=414771 RepID=A0A2Z2KF66_9BACL|nr:FtsX-like permease family protein [Paenibacillus donghaensis]ASA24417.1 ABC transporter permease [Paenibacillus donghaensis]